MNSGDVSIETLDSVFQNYESELEKIIKNELPVRDPWIYVVKISPKDAKIAFKRHQSMLKKLHERHPSWEFKIFNVEKHLFDILKKRRYIDKQQFAKKCDRAVLSNDMKGPFSKELIDEIQAEINALKEKKKEANAPPFLVLVNMHSTYPFIETKDVIARILDEKGVIVLILYLIEKKYSQEDDEPFKKANYTVHTRSLIPQNN